MQRTLVDLLLGDPGQFGTFLVRDGRQSSRNIGDHRRVCPATGGGAGYPAAPHSNRSGGNSGFLLCFSHRGVHAGLMTVARTAGQRPRSTLMAPGCAVLQQDHRTTAGPRRPQQQSGRTEQTPLPCPVRAHQKPVSITAHTPPRPDRGRQPDPRRPRDIAVMPDTCPAVPVRPQ